MTAGPSLPAGVDDADAPPPTPAGRSKERAGEKEGGAATSATPSAPEGGAGKAAEGAAAQGASASPFYRSYRVLEVLPLKAAAISKWAKANDVGALEIKKRGADLDPATLRAAAKLRGSGAATLIATRVEGRHRAIVVEPLG